MAPKVVKREVAPVEEAGETVDVELDELFGELEASRDD